MTRKAAWGDFSRWSGLLAAGAIGMAGCVSESGTGSADGAGSMDHSAHAAGGVGGADRQAVHLTVDQERALGVVFTDVQRRTLERTIRTVGRIVAAESRVSDVTPKISGFVEHLHVATSGEEVRRGQPLLTLYSPELVAAQEELLTANRLAARTAGTGAEAGQGARDMLEAARKRLAWWDITDEQIRRLETSGEITKTLTLVAPASGVILEKNVVQGQQVTSGQALYRLADLDEVWVEGDVFERDLSLVGLGAETHIEVSAYPGEHMMGRVSFIYPTVDVASRTNRVRVTLPNPDMRFKPGMFATVFFDAVIAVDAVAIPVDAVLVTGERNLVFVRQEGLLVPREVVVGAHAHDWVEIISGLEPGESVVASANFLIDAESRLSATGGEMPGMGHSGHGSAVEPGSASSEPGQAADHSGHIRAIPDSTPEGRHD